MLDFLYCGSVVDDDDDAHCKVFFTKITELNHDLSKLHISIPYIYLHFCIRICRVELIALLIAQNCKTDPHTHTQAGKSNDDLLHREKKRKKIVTTSEKKQKGKKAQPK